MKIASLSSGYAACCRMWQGFLALIYPPLCVNCSVALTESDVLCADCEEALVLWPSDRPLSDRLPSRKGLTLLPPLCVYEKKGLPAHLIHAFKYQRQRHIGRALSRRYALRLSSSDAVDYELVTAVPMHWWRLSRRGFNQSTIIARAIAQQLQLPMIHTIQRRYSRRQVGMGASDRWQNVQTKFRLRPTAQVRSKKVLLVDDVLTTGATAMACAEVLLAEGAAKVGVCVLALRG